jgi:phosphopantothenoylcysteine decarboxylase/phosphopantothenate--cysteine ligase
MSYANKPCVVLGVSGSVAIYKACDVASKLTQVGVSVRAVLTESAAKLVSPALFRAITGHHACVSEFDPGAGAPMLHIDIAHSADLFLVAPASAGSIGKLANGLADDLLSTTALVLDAKVPRAIAPAMNPNMWAAPPVRENITKLKSYGYHVIEPGIGWTACGIPGPGRLAEPQDIVQFALERLGLSKSQPRRKGR